LTKAQLMEHEIIALILFGLIFLIILSGYPVAISLGGISVIAGLIFVPDFLDLLPLRIMGVMENQVLIAIPLFIFMGLMLEKSGLAESLLQNMSYLFGKMRGGLAVSVILVGAFLAASTGIVGATVVTMGLISLPIMLKKGYQKELATGVIASSGTLGQIIPPSIVLVILGSVMNISVGELFKAAVVPGLLLVLLYILWVVYYSYKYPEKVPVSTRDSNLNWKDRTIILDLAKSFMMPMLLMLLVLGSIFIGLASPTEAAGIGAGGAAFLAWVNGKLNIKNIKEVATDSSYLTSMIFLILLGATTFALVFRGLGGEKYLLEIVLQAELGPVAFLVLVMAVMFVSGFFIDFIEIVFIFVPILTPLFIAYDLDLIWVAILIAMNLQTSFLTPPFGFSLFYLKGVAPASITTGVLYRGIIPFLIIQLVLLFCILLFPGLLFYR
jgi:tripartite ATP-independent transporter DctM subunit